jgi:hypothetical protein
MLKSIKKRELLMKWRNEIVKKDKEEINVSCVIRDNKGN